MPEANEVVEPGTEATGAETTETQPTAEQIAEWKAAAEKLTAFGGDSALAEAENLRTQLGTDEGVVAMFIESGRALGLGADKLEGLFEEGTKIVEQHQEQHPEDKPLTKDEITALITETVLKPMQQQQAQSAAATARNTIDSTIRSLGFDPKDDKQAEDIDFVLRFADKYLQPNDLDPDHIAAAVRQGFDDFGKLSSERQAKYLAGKRETQTQVPKPTGGSAASGATTLPEPKNVKEAAERARARLRAAG